MSADGYNELAERYGFEVPPESVARLTKLVASQDSDRSEIAQLISQDKGLTARLLRAANPRAKSEAEYTVDNTESALMRAGFGCVLLLAMGSPLTQAVEKTFALMCDLKLESVHPGSLEPFQGEHLLGTIGFSGKAKGEVLLRLSLEGSRVAAARMLGRQPDQIDSAAELDDAVGELLNICIGNLKSNLCDAGLGCELTPPFVTRARDFAVHTLPGGGLERMAFRNPNIVIFVDVTVNPFNDE